MCCWLGWKWNEVLVKITKKQKRAICLHYYNTHSSALLVGGLVKTASGYSLNILLQRIDTWTIQKPAEVVREAEEKLSSSTTTAAFTVTITHRIKNTNKKGIYFFSTPSPSLWSYQTTILNVYINDIDEVCVCVSFVSLFLFSQHRSCCWVKLDFRLDRKKRDKTYPTNHTTKKTCCCWYSSKNWIHMILIKDFHWIG